MKKIPITGLLPNSSYSVSVRGKDVSGNYTEWSKFVTFTTVADTAAPSTPSAPTVSTGSPQNIIVTHNLTKSGGGNLEKDVRYLEVYVINSQVGATETYVGNIPVGPLSIGSVSQSFFYPLPSNDPAYPSGITAKARVKAVDASGNKSDYSSYSADSSAIPFFDAAYITNLTVGSLSADDITTGTLQAGVAISVGNTTPIVLKSNSTTPYGQIYIGTGTYGNANTPFYVASDNKFSLGSNLTWDGTALSITGAITASSGTFNGNINAAGGTFTGFVTFGTATLGKDNFTVSSVTYSGLKIDANNYWGVSAAPAAILKIGGASNYVQWNGSQLDVVGVITATSGSFSGSMTVGTNFYIGNNIKFSNAASTYRGFVLDADANPSRNYWIYDGSAYKFQVGNSTRYISWDGSNTLTISGNVTIGSNTASDLITGTQVNSNVTSISGGVITTGTINLNNVNVRTGTSGARINIDSTGLKIYNSGGTNTVSLNSDGSASFTGTINASAGTIGGFTINSNSLVAGVSFSLDTSTSTIIATGGVTTTTLTATTVTGITDLTIKAGTGAVYGGSSMYNDAVTGRTLLISGSGIYRIGTSASTRRVKTEIGNADNFDFDQLLNLPIQKFKYKEDVENNGSLAKWHYGLMAEDLAEDGLEWLIDRDDENLPAYIYWSERMPQALLALAQKQHSKIQELETRIAALE